MIIIPRVIANRLPGSATGADRASRIFIEPPPAFHTIVRIKGPLSAASRTTVVVTGANLPLIVCGRGKENRRYTTVRVIGRSVIRGSLDHEMRVCNTTLIGRGTRSRTLLEINIVDYC